MVEPTVQDRSAPEMSVWMFWQINDDGGVVPRMNLNNDDMRQEVFEEFGVDSLDELESELLPSHHTVDQLRLGVVCGPKGDASFFSEVELLASVDGISEELAEGLLDECRDIPTMCARRRGDGDVFLGDVRHNAEVEDREWVDELNEFIDELSHRDDLERRMKDAGVWVESETETAAA